MATYYVNPVSGNDANDGLTFANAWKTITDGATAVRIAPGDFIRVMKTPDPTLIGPGKWNSKIDIKHSEGVTITGATNTTPITITAVGHGYSADDYIAITAVGGNTNANGLWKIANVTTDTFDLVSSVGNASYTSDGIATQYTSCVVELTTAATRNISLTDNIGKSSSNSVVWTASANVTTTLGSQTTDVAPPSMSVTIAAGFTTGKAAYKSITSTDFSSYQQLSFKFSQTSGTLLSAGGVKLCLCSDTVGNVIVDEFLIPAQPYLSTNLLAFTIDKNANLGTAIQSIALYVVTDTGATQLYLSDIIASKASESADSLSLTSLIGKNNSSEPFFATRSISDTVILLDIWSTGYGNNGLGYYGSAETASTYKIEPFYLYPSYNGTGDGATVNASGTDGNLITFSGGWNDSDMSSVTGTTYFVGSLSGNGIAVANLSYISISNLNFIRYWNAAYLYYSNYITFSSSTVGTNDIGLYIDSSNNCTVNNLIVTCCQSGIYGFGLDLYSIFMANTTIAGCTSGCELTNYIVAEISSLTVINAALCISHEDITSYTANDISVSNGTMSGYAVSLIVVGAATNVSIFNVAKNGLRIDGADMFTVTDFTVDQCGTIGDPNGCVTIDNAVLNNGSFGSVALNPNNKIKSSTKQSRMNLTNVTGLSTTPFTTYAIPLAALTNVSTTDSTVLNGTMYHGLFTAFKDSTTYHGATSNSWKITQTVDYMTANRPIIFPLANIAAVPNVLTTVSVWVKNSASTITGKLICPGWQLNGTDVSSTTSGLTDTWELLTISFTPTVSSVVNIYIYAYGSQNDYLYVSDMTITQ